MRSDLIVCDGVEAPRLPGRILLVPWGQQVANKKKFIVNDESAKLIQEEFTRHRVEVPIDYDHRTLGGEYSSPMGMAPAAGWVREIEPIPGQGIFGKVDWTPEGSRRVANKEYRYISPVLILRPRDGVATSLHSAGLTNKPAIAGMPALVNKQNDTDTGDSGMEELLKFLCTEYGLHDDATPEQILQKMRSGKSEIANSARLVANVDRLQMENAGLCDKLVCAEVRTLLLEHSGKVPPAQVDWFTDYYRREPVAAKAWLDKAAIMVAHERVVVGGCNTAGSQGERNRTSIVQGSRRTFSDAKALGGVACSERAWVNEKLGDAGLALLTQEEARGLGILTD